MQHLKIDIKNEVEIDGKKIHSTSIVNTGGDLNTNDFNCYKKESVTTPSVRKCPINNTTDRDNTTNSDNTIGNDTDFIKIDTPDINKSDLKRTINKDLKAILQGLQEDFFVISNSSSCKPFTRDDLLVVELDKSSKILPIQLYSVSFRIGPNMTHNNIINCINKPALYLIPLSTLEREDFINNVIKYIEKDFTFFNKIKECLEFIFSKTLTESEVTLHLHNFINNSINNIRIVIFSNVNYKDVVHYIDTISRRFKNIRFFYYNVAGKYEDKYIYTLNK